MPTTKLTNEQIQAIINANCDEWNSVKIVLPDGFQKGNASRMRKDRGLKAFDAISYSYREDFFFSGGLKACYWAGLIAADGYIRMNDGKYPVVGIALKSTDCEHLQRFLDDLGGGKVRYGSTKLGEAEFKSARVHVCNAKIYQGLTDRFNITERKSLTLKPPVGLNPEESLAFIAGYIDGDGSYTHNTQNNRVAPVISVLGTTEVLNWIKSVFGYPDKKLYAQEKIKELKFYGKDAIDVRSQLYTLEDKIPFLARKYKRWESLGIDLELW